MILSQSQLSIFDSWEVAEAVLAAEKMVRLLLFSVALSFELCSFNPRKNLLGMTDFDNVDTGDSADRREAALMSVNRSVKVLRKTPILISNNILDSSTSE
jgi:hypothetical protein